ncbi:urea carboxylase-associated family protein [Amycolatopsis cynarae]|uniref:Urea carboxylase-associated family protein n=1 Tax=Amycolatopsis cynarae TaxID=2995223 RepID=A0ABY7B227_9PSEU|nr:urea carboxylase-associated family protein [Amycolatopsis sp. HUAS 11-8]WAL65997.1 urea carboxylase-associated family protein [Amycolatopsis sp. HUAS 11-8]
MTTAPARSHVLAAGTGAAYHLPAGATAVIVNRHGAQVVDTWAVAAADPAEHLSMTHTRGVLNRLSPSAGDTLYSNRRRPMLRLDRDTSPGVHDTLIPACDRERYRLLGHQGFHRNCRDNFAAAVEPFGLPGEAPAPLNLFMNIPVDSDGGLSYQPSVARPGDLVELVALVELYLVLSACPQDLVPINGSRLNPADVDILLRNPA